MIKHKSCYFLLLIILFIGLFSIGKAQTLKLPAQENEMEEGVSGTGQGFSDLDRLNEQLGKAKAYLFIENVDSASLVITPLIKELSAMNLLDSPLGLEARLIKANTLELNNARGDALEEIFSLIEACKAQKEWLTLSRTYMVAELAYEFLDKPERCLFYFNQCRAVIEEHNLAYNYPRFYNRFSTYHRIWGDRDSSYYYAEEALRTAKIIYKAQEGNFIKKIYEDISPEYATAHTILGGLYRAEGDLEKAKYYFEQSKLIWQKAGNDFSMTMIFLHLSSLSSAQNDYETALLYNDTCLSYGKAIYDSWGMLGIELRSRTLLARAGIYEALNQRDSVYQLLKQGYQEKIKVLNARNNLHATEIEARHTDQQKAFKIDQQKEQLDREEKWRLGLIGILTAFFLLAIGLVYFYLQLRKANQKTKIQAEELLALDKVKSNFFANISHELRTPLTLILGPLSYILDSPNEWKKEHIQQQLLIMQRNGKSLMQLIEEILDLSKLEASKLELQEENTAVDQFFEYIFFVFEPRFQNLEIDYELQLKVKDKLHILLDRKKIEKVLNNFLSNALKFTPKGGKITLSVTEKPTNLLIQVSDTGKGVHPKDLPYIFERFYQSNQANQKLYGGTGIGLALVNEFAQLMQGKAYAKSTLGEGSHFFFELPKKVVTIEKVMDLPTTAIIENEPIYSIGTDFTILVVEDNEDMRNFIFQLLQKQYKRVLVAKDGAEGLEFLKEYGTDIQLVISDVMMPKVDGLTMLEEIKNTAEWQGIPVVMLTALAAERDKLNALTIGVDDYLTKPFSVPELQLRVQNLLYNYHQRLEIKTNETDNDIAQAHTIEKEKKPRHISSIDKQWIINLISYIEQSITKQNVDVDHLTQHLFVSKKQLNRKLKSISGLTTARFIKEVQLQLARRILEDGVQFSIADVAYDAGFKSQATFSTLFKHRFGKSPKEYLK